MSNKFGIWVGVLLAMACGTAGEGWGQAPPPSAGAPPNATLSLELIPQGVLDDRRSQLFVTTESTDELHDAVLEIAGPSDLSLDRAVIPLPVFSRSIIRSTSITATSGNPLAGDRALTVTLSVAGPNNTRRVLVSKLLKFNFAPEIPLWTFFLIGALGLVLGYWLRIIIKVLAEITPPPALAPEAPVGPITRFVRSHYYSVDFGVTGGLAFILLVTLCHDGRPPQSGTTWYGAFATGVGLGLFTNSELLTRLKK